MHGALPAALPAVEVVEGELANDWCSAGAHTHRLLCLAQHPLVKQIAAKYNKHVLSLLLRWGIQRGNSVLAKSSNPHHIRGNLEGCLGWSISEEDMHKLSTIEFQLRLVDGIRFLRPEGPFRCASRSTQSAVACWARPPFRGTPSSPGSGKSSCKVSLHQHVNPGKPRSADGGRVMQEYARHVG